MASKTNYEQIAQEYLNRVKTRPGFEQSLTDEVGRVTNNNRDLLDRKAAIQTDIRALPDSMRLQFSSGNIRNPLEQEKIIQGKLGSLQGSYGNTLDVLRERKAYFDDILSKVLRGWDSDTEGMRLSSENAWRSYQDDVGQEQFAKQMAQQEKLARLARSGGGGGSAGINTAAIEKAIAEQRKVNTTNFSKFWQQLQTANNPVQRQQLSSSMLNILGDSDFAQNPMWQSKLAFIQQNPALNSASGKTINLNRR